MFFRSLCRLLIPALFSASLFADTLKINPNHPDRYTVVKGDTLWDISGKFLQNPWQWPRLWENNQHIKNPHLIYPGDILSLTYVDGKPTLSLTRSAYVKLSPAIRTSSQDEAIKMIPSEAISQFLTSPRVINENDLDDAPYVIDFADEHLIGGAGDRVYVRTIEEPKSINYTIFRKGDAFISPDNDEILGYEAQYIADAGIQRAGDPATLFINKSDSEIRIGDRLMSSESNPLAINYFPHVPKTQLEGNIISVLNGVSQIGRFNVVVIDKGITDGIETGHLFDVYRKGKTINDRFYHDDISTTVKLPDEIAGMLMVFRPFERVSYAVIMEANSPIHILDKIRTP